MKKLWKINENVNYMVTDLAARLGVSPLLCQLLINRGLSEPQKAEAFLAPDMTQLHNPFLFKDMERAVQRIKQAIQNKERILIYGDYDVDGISSVALMIRVLARYLPGNLLYYIPKRLEEGYGLHLNSLEKAISKEIDLIITVDCGISAALEAAYLKTKGIDLIITDHHEPPPSLPEAYAILNPKIPNSGYPFSQLAGVGVTYKLLQALGTGADLPDLAGRLSDNMDLVALGTIADIVPLLEENRVLVKYGLEKIQKTGNLGLQSLIQSAGLKDKELNCSHIGYILAPRINAAGRIGNPNLGLKLLLTNEPTLALELAQELEKANKTRQEIENQVWQEAQQQIEGCPRMLEDHALVLFGEGWHIGVIGIVASKLVEQYHKPVILIGLDGEEGRGSGRSIPGFNLFEAINECSQFLTRFGGHEFAAGISIERSQIPSFTQAFLQLTRERIMKEALNPILVIESLVDFNQLTLGLARELEKLAPYGSANPVPILGCRSLDLIGYKNVGENGKHLKVKISNKQITREGIGFNLGLVNQELASAREVDVAFSLEENNWNGFTQVQLNLKDVVARRSHQSE
ncbi:MAG TPA: single-stranded-DNA-specific exonuclease RecJ [Bacillota bacterium]|nr:single-stranded-DNA-specific exonuclease RecJ [Bacillota bacterium]